MIVDQDNDRGIANVLESGRPEQVWQDAFLMASSNDLLEALLNIMREIDHPIARRKLASFITKKN